MSANVDPRIEKMVAYLYGELPESEERAFRRLLQDDDALRTEYEELAATRETLRGWEVEERAPSFVLVDGAAPAERPGRRAAARGGWWARFTDGLRTIAITPAWGLAATALVLFVLAAAGFRVDRVDGGVALRFGGRAGAPAQVATSPTPPRPTDRESASVPASVAASVPATGAIPPASSLADAPPAAYVTHKDLETYNSNLMLTLAELLNQYSRKRDHDVTEGFQSLYQQVTSQRTYDYEQLSGRIDMLGRDLLLETNRNARGFQEVLHNRPTDDAAPPESTDSREE
jgi:anti-sigma factor RsiW